MLEIRQFADEMRHRFENHQCTDHSTNIANLTVAQAYSVQDEFVAARVRDGAKIVGWKVGCTSPAIRKQFGLSQPISGKLLEPDIFASGINLNSTRFVECAVEPELVFRLGESLAGEIDDERVLGSLASVCAGIELHNYHFWLGYPTVQELIASNGIHAGLVLSDFQSLPQEWDSESERVSILVNDQVQASATSKEIMGGPLRSIEWLAKHAAERGQPLRAGDLVIPGSAVELVRVKAGDAIEARFERLGSCKACLT